MGRPKTKWFTYSQAKRESNRLTKKHGILFKSYRCGECSGYHTAKVFQTKEVSQWVINLSKNEALAGKLVYALRKVLDK